MSSGAESYVAIFPADPLDPREIPGLPAGPGEQINFTDDDLGASISTTKSDHIRPDRMTQDVTVTGIEVAGGFNSELHFEQDLNDKLLAAALWGVWEGIFSTGTLITGIETATASGSALDLSPLALPPDNLFPGCAIRIQGSSLDNDGMYTITGVTAASEYTVSPPFPSAETFGAGSSLDGEFVRNASVRAPFFIERGHVDVDEYFQFKGMYVDSMSQEYPDQELITLGYAFIGFESSVIQSPTYTDYTPPSSNPSMSSVSHIPSIRIDGVETDDCLVQAFGLEVANNSSAKTGVGVFGACGVTPHRFEVTGSLTMYFNSSTMYEWLLEGNEFSFGWTLEDSAGNGYVYNMQRCKLTEDTVNVSGIDDDVMDEAAYEALADPESNAAIIISRFPADRTL